MLICFDARVIINEKTEIGNYSFNLLNTLLEIDNKNKYVALVNKELNKNHDIFSLKSSNFRINIVDIEPVSVRQQWAIAKEIKKINPDIYHYPNWDIPVFQNNVSIFTIHDLSYILHKKLYMKLGLLKKLYTSLNIYYGLKKSTRIIAVSESKKKDIIDLYKVSPKKINII